MFPAERIGFSDKIERIDLHFFRHEIAISDDIYPDPWKTPEQ
jgi:hypothetical protein